MAAKAKSIVSNSAISAALREFLQIWEGKMKLNETTSIIISKAIHIHRQLGPGLLESVYHRIFVYELKKTGLQVESELPVPVVWDDLTFEEGFRADLVVENKVLVELKSVEELRKVHYKQVITYIKLADKRLGLLINFNVPILKHGIKRIVNDFED